MCTIPRRKQAKSIQTINRKIKRNFKRLLISCDSEQLKLYTLLQTNMAVMKVAYFNTIFVVTMLTASFNIQNLSIFPQCTFRFCVILTTKISYSNIYFTHHHSATKSGLTFLYPCFTSINVNDDQQDATILAYLFIPSQLYMFRAMSSPVIRTT